MMPVGLDLASQRWFPELTLPDGYRHLSHLASIRTEARVAAPELYAGGVPCCMPVEDPVATYRTPAPNT